MPSVIKKAGSVFRSLLFSKTGMSEIPSKLLIQKHYLTENEAVEIIRERLEVRREKNEIARGLPEKPHMFIAVKNVNWEQVGLVDSWKDLANIVHFDWGARFDQYSPAWQGKGKIEFNEILLEKVKREHVSKSIDIFLSYLSGKWVFPETIDEIRKLGIITINLGFDDTLKFWGCKEKNNWTGNAGIAPCFDFSVFFSRELDIVKYNMVGANAVFLPPGGNQAVYGTAEPFDKRELPVSFIGQNYGARKELIEFLRDKGVAVYVRGKGWPEGPVPLEEMLNIYRKSLLTLGFGYINDTRITQLKGRDFEVPMSGAAYLTSYRDDLAQYFIPDEEIILYRDRNELLEKIKYYTGKPEEAVAIGAAGRARAICEHTWDKRWARVLEICK